MFKIRHPFQIGTTASFVTIQAVFVCLFVCFIKFDQVRFFFISFFTTPVVCLLPSFVLSPCVILYTRTKKVLAAQADAEKIKVWLCCSLILLILNIALPKEVI